MEIKFYGVFVLNRRVAPDVLADFHTGINGEYEIRCTRGQKRQDCTTLGTKTWRDRLHASDGL